MIRRAENKGVVVREVPFDDALVRGISEIYDESLVRQGRPFWHYGKDLAAVRRENGTFLDRSVFLGAFADAKLIGFAKLVSAETGGQASLMQILSDDPSSRQGADECIDRDAVRSCATRSIPYLVYANFSYGKKRQDGLSEFKQHNGFQRVELPR